MNRPSKLQERLSAYETNAVKKDNFGRFGNTSMSSEEAVFMNSPVKKQAMRRRSSIASLYETKMMNGGDAANFKFNKLAHGSVSTVPTEDSFSLNDSFSHHAEVRHVSPSSSHSKPMTDKVSVTSALNKEKPVVGVVSVKDRLKNPFGQASSPTGPVRTPEAVPKFGRRSSMSAVMEKQSDMVAKPALQEGSSEPLKLSPVAPSKPKVAAHSPTSNSKAGDTEIAACSGLLKDRMSKLYGSNTTKSEIPQAPTGSPKKFVPAATAKQFGRRSSISTFSPTPSLSAKKENGADEKKDEDFSKPVCKKMQPDKPFEHGEDKDPQHVSKKPTQWSPPKPLGKRSSVSTFSKTTSESTGINVVQRNNNDNNDRHVEKEEEKVSDAVPCTSVNQDVTLGNSYTGDFGLTSFEEQMRLARERALQAQGGKSPPGCLNKSNKVPFGRRSSMSAIPQKTSLSSTPFSGDNQNSSSHGNGPKRYGVATKKVEQEEKIETKNAVKNSDTLSQGVRSSAMEEACKVLDQKCTSSDNQDSNDENEGDTSSDVVPSTVVNQDLTSGNLYTGDFGLTSFEEQMRLARERALQAQGGKSPPGSLNKSDKVPFGRRSSMSAIPQKTSLSSTPFSGDNQNSSSHRNGPKRYGVATKKVEQEEKIEKKNAVKNADTLSQGVRSSAMEEACKVLDQKCTSSDNQDSNDENEGDTSSDVVPSTVVNQDLTSGNLYTGDFGLTSFEEQMRLARERALKAKDGEKPSSSSSSRDISSLTNRFMNAAKQAESAQPSFGKSSSASKIPHKPSQDKCDGSPIDDEVPKRCVLASKQVAQEETSQTCHESDTNNSSDDDNDDDEVKGEKFVNQEAISGASCYTGDFGLTSFEEQMRLARERARQSKPLVKTGGSSLKDRMSMFK